MLEGGSLKVALLKYNAGNTQSVVFALQRLGINPVITDDSEILSSADRVIIPGVGSAAPAMRYIRERCLTKVIQDLKSPVLGICLGLQILCDYSEEGDLNTEIGTDCLGVFPVRVQRFTKPRKIPHMGWNTILTHDSPLFNEIDSDTSVYFVHSYRAELSKDYTIATAEHEEVFSAALARDNFYATQFHPEKSGSDGSEILQSFLSL